MVKFKLFKKGTKGLKCLLKKTFMASSSNNKASPSKHGNLPEGKQSVPSASSAEGFIPLAARDSQWVGLDFYNPNFRSPLDEEDDADEAELHALAADGAEAILLLFPGLNKKKNKKLKDNDSSSTTEITKLLVGQKADFRNMKSSRKLIAHDNKLSSVPEVPQEDKNQSDIDISTTDTIPAASVTKKSSFSDDGDFYDEEEDAQPKRATHTKKRKKKSDVKILVAEDVSSVTIIETLRRKPSSRIKADIQRTSTSQESHFADDESTPKK